MGTTKRHSDLGCILEMGSLKMINLSSFLPMEVLESQGEYSLLNGDFYWRLLLLEWLSSCFGPKQWRLSLVTMAFLLLYNSLCTNDFVSCLFSFVLVNLLQLWTLSICLLIHLKLLILPFVVYSILFYVLIPFGKIYSYDGCMS